MMGSNRGCGSNFSYKKCCKIVKGHTCLFIELSQAFRKNHINIYEIFQYLFYLDNSNFVLHN